MEFNKQVRNSHIVTTDQPGLTPLYHLKSYKPIINIVLRLKQQSACATTHKKQQHNIADPQDHITLLSLVEFA